MNIWFSLQHKDDMLSLWHLWPIHYSLPHSKSITTMSKIINYIASSWYILCIRSNSHPTMYQTKVHGLFFEIHILLDPLHEHNQLHKVGLSLHQSDLKGYKYVNKCSNVTSGIRNTVHHAKCCNWEVRQLAFR